MAPASNRSPLSKPAGSSPHDNDPAKQSTTAQHPDNSAPPSGAAAPANTPSAPPSALSPHLTGRGVTASTAPAASSPSSHAATSPSAVPLGFSSHNLVATSNLPLATSAAPSALASPLVGPGATVPGFVRPSSYLRPRGLSRPSPMSALAAAPATAMAVPEPVKEPWTAMDREQAEGLKAMRQFLKLRTSYDVLPLSFRLIILDTSLLVKASLNVLHMNGIVSAPLWDSKTSTFAGLLTTSDYINVIQYYWQNPDALAQIDQFRLSSLPEIEKALGVAPVETISIHPERPLYEACQRMLESKARRIPLVDVDDETQRAMVVSVITQYRILKFIAVNNVKETTMLKKPLKELKSVGTYKGVATCSMDTPVIDVIHLLVRKNISSVPIIDKDGILLNVFESVDVIPLIKGGSYDDLNLTVGEALLKRADEFAGIHTCSQFDCLDTIFDTLRKSRVHRFIVVDHLRRLQGVLTLSDILDYVLLQGETEE